MQLNDSDEDLMAALSSEEIRLLLRWRLICRTIVTCVALIGFAWIITTMYRAI